MNDPDWQREFSIYVRVYYEDTDVGGVVYYANYLKYMERARTEFLRGAGFDQGALLERQRRQFVVRRSAVDYIRPARLDDLLRVTAVVARVRKASVEFEQTCWRQLTQLNADTSQNRYKHDAGKEKFEHVASGKMLIACLDADSYKPTAIPENMQMVLGR